MLWYTRFSSNLSCLYRLTFKLNDAIYLEKEAIPKKNIEYLKSIYILLDIYNMHNHQLGLLAVLVHHIREVPVVFHVYSNKPTSSTVIP